MNLEESVERTKNFARFAVIIGVVFSSTSGIFSRLITANAMTIGFYRLSMSVPFLFLPIAFKKFKPLQDIEKRDWIWMILAGVFLFAHFASWFAAVKHTTIASAVVLAALHPVVTLFASVVVFKRTIPWLAVIGILMALTGGGIVAGFDYSFGGENMVGNLLAVSAAFNMGVYFIIGDRIRARISASAYVFVVFLVCWLCFFIAMLVTGTSFTGYPKQDWLLFAAATLFCQFGFHGVTNWSLGYVSSLYVSVWSVADIVFATIFAFLVFAEIPDARQVVGGVVAIAGLLIYNIKSEEGETDEL